MITIRQDSLAALLIMTLVFFVLFAVALALLICEYHDSDEKDKEIKLYKTLYQNERAKKLNHERRYKRRAKK